MEQHQCPQCGSKIEGERPKYCDQCGWDLSSIKTSVQNESQPATQSESVAHKEEYIIGSSVDQSKMQSNVIKADVVLDIGEGGNVVAGSAAGNGVMQGNIIEAKLHGEKDDKQDINSYLPKGALMNYAEQKMDKRQSSMGLLVSFNVNKLYMQGYGGVIDLKVENLSDSVFTSFCLEITSRGFLASDKEKWSKKKLDPCECIWKKFDVNPSRPSTGQLIDMTLTIKKGDTSYVFGMQKVVPVFKETKEIRNVRVQIGNLVAGSATDEAKSMGNVITNHFSDIIKLPDIKNVDDLIQAYDRMDAHYEPLILELEDEICNAPPAYIIHAARGTHTQTASLKIRGKRINQNLVLVTKSAVTLGKKRGNDVVTRFGPRNEINDLQTKHISSNHCRLELRELGLFIVDPGSTNGTTWQEHKVPPAGLMVRQDEGILELGGAMKLKLRRFGRKTLKIEDYHSAFIGYDATWDMASKTDLLAVTLDREDNLGPQDPNGSEQYCVVYLAATIGSDPGTAMCFKDSGLEPVHAAIFYRNNRFYLENLTEINNVKVNREQLSKNQLMPMEFGDTIHIAHLEMEFQPKCQLFLDGN